MSQSTLAINYDGLLVQLVLAMYTYNFYLQREFYYTCHNKLQANNLPCEMICVMFIYLTIQIYMVRSGAY